MQVNSSFLNSAISLFLVLLVITSCSHLSPPKRALSSSEERERKTANVEFENCEKMLQRFPSLFSKDKIECTSDYLLFEAPEKKIKSTKSLKIGSFNIIRIGQAQTRFKRSDLVAQIINRWDLVNVVEIMTTPQDILSFNEKIDAILESAPESIKEIESSFELPRYLLILKELRDLDSSWSLVMAPMGTGETTPSYEYSGFFYRNGVVKNTTTDFCNGKRGCLVSTEEEFTNLVSRSPFVAHFKADALEFNAAGMHSRFRVPASDCNSVTGSKLVQSLQKSSIAKAVAPKAKPCVPYSKGEKNLVNDFLKLTGRNKINKEDARFLELAIVYKELMKSKADVLLMGDFNLEYKDSNKKLWNYSLGHDNVFVHEKTSISFKFGLANQYDHFIFKPENNLAKCDVSSAKAFSFVLDPKAPVSTEASLKDLVQFIKDRNSKSGQMLNVFKNELLKSKIVSSCQNKMCDYVPKHNAETVDQLLCAYERNVLGNEQKICKVEKVDDADEVDDSVGAVNKVPYKFYAEIISDHIPIEMECARTL